MPDADNAVGNELTIRFATEADCATILDFIRRLSVYEKLEHEVVATVEGLRDSIFAKRQAEVLIAEWAGTPAAFALFFQNYSTFVGRGNIYLEDLFALEEYRGRGIGKALLTRLAAIAVERGCARVDWACLDWNTNSIAFYERLGARAMSDWTVFRLEGEALTRLGRGI